MWFREAKSVTPPPFVANPALTTAPLPKILWIELTSKCPFDCIFCTRKSRFGTGRHLDFELYQRLIAELQAPDFIGLNYSGESIYYPRLREAVALAVSTGAFTELVTAFSTISEPLLRFLVESGLDRLAVSLHTMDAEQYQRIYRLGSLDMLKRRVADFLSMRQSLGQKKPRMDFCFVAMEENLDQLPRVAAFATEVGVPEIFVHPIIGRHLTPSLFPNELAGHRMRGQFKENLRRALSAARGSNPALPITVLNSDLEPAPALSPFPVYFGPPLPEGARLHTCDQSPFESLHVLSTGDAVVCEVHDEVSMGNLHQATLRDIWHGEHYREFRAKYLSDPPAECRNCVWKFAYVPGSFEQAVEVRGGMSPQLVRGWHAHEPEGGTIWGKRESLVGLFAPKFSKMVFSGTLPPGPPGSANVLTVQANQATIAEFSNSTEGMLPFSKSCALPQRSGEIYASFQVKHLFRPSLHGASNDARDLGFGLHSIRLE